jgi:FtsP/CotA-like multicopper oxidase with cupredoxin domain
MKGIDSMKLLKISPVAALLVVACGGGEPQANAPAAQPAAQPAAAPAGPMAPTGPMTVPSWYVVDNAARTVTLTMIAGETPDNNYWNFNGHIRGQLAITVPVGYTVNLDLVNRDPNMAHSVGISSELANFAMPPAPNPVFPGAITENPQSMVDGVMPGETERITFVAATAGNYSMVCYIAGHSAVGMWLFFNVSADGEAGVQGL